MNNRKHYAAAISAFLIWGFFSIPLRALKSYPVGEILYFRIFFSALIMVIVVAAFKRADIRKDWSTLQALARPDRTRVILLTLAGGALLSINWLLFIYTVNTINVRTASFAYLICPVLTAVLAYLLLNEKLALFQWIAVGICALSCVLIGFQSAPELGYSLFTALSYALYLVSQRKTQGFDRLISLGIQILFSIFILTVFFGQLVVEVPSSGRFYSIILLIAGVFTVLPLFLNLYALNQINSATIGILMYINPIFNFSVAFLVFHETVNVIQLVGYFAIVVALVIFNYGNFGKMRAALKP
jgi:chloramphenicol-sensitive protein RarD